MTTTTVVPTATRAAKVLDAAAWCVQADGLHKGSYGGPEEGWCVNGAIVFAGNDDWPAIDLATRAVEHILGSKHLWLWNDALDTVAGDVLLVLDKARRMFSREEAWACLVW